MYWLKPNIPKANYVSYTVHVFYVLLKAHSSFQTKNASLCNFHVAKTISKSITQVFRNRSRSLTSFVLSHSSQIFSPGKQECILYFFNFHFKISFLPFCLGVRAWFRPQQGLAITKLNVWDLGIYFQKLSFSLVEHPYQQIPNASRLQKPSTILV